MKPSQCAQETLYNLELTGKRSGEVMHLQLLQTAWGRLANWRSTQNNAAGKVPGERGAKAPHWKSMVTRPERIGAKIRAQYFGVLAESLLICSESDALVCRSGAQLNGAYSRPTLYFKNLVRM